MIEVLAAAAPAAAEAAGNGIAGPAIGAAGGVALTVAGLLIKRGFSIRVGNNGTDSKSVDAAGECPLHAPLVKQLDEREQNRQRDHAETVQGLRDLQTAVASGFQRVHERIDKMH